MPDSTVRPRETIDLRGLKCPLPVLRARRILGRLTTGDVVAIVCTDPLAGLDVPNLVRETGDSLLCTSRDGTETWFLIRKG
ncbi:MAG: sulfurtransferase TusA family protein [Janthinobacterium lividum]